MSDDKPKYHVIVDSGAPTLYNKLARAKKDYGQMGISFAKRKFDDHTYTELPEYERFMSEYISFIKTKEASLFGYFNLDVINNAKLTRRNQRRLERDNISPIPIYHLGQERKWLDQLLERYDYIALGGLIPNPTTVLKPILDDLWSKHLCHKDGTPKVKVHGLAVTSPRIMYLYPWYSVDSTSWRKLAAYGKIFVPSNLDKRKDTWAMKRSPSTGKLEGPRMLPVSSLQKKTIRLGQHWNSKNPALQEAIEEFTKEYGYSIEELAGVQDKEASEEAKSGYKIRTGWNALYFMMLEEVMDVKIFLAGPDAQTLQELDRAVKASKKKECHVLFSYYYLKSEGSGQRKAFDWYIDGVRRGW